MSLKTAQISNAANIVYVNRLRKMLSFKLDFFYSTIKIKTCNVNLAAIFKNFVAFRVQALFSRRQYCMKK